MLTVATVEMMFGVASMIFIVVGIQYCVCHIRLHMLFIVVLIQLTIVTVWALFLVNSCKFVPHQVGSMGLVDSL